jgi:hypothetical protein
MGSMHSHGMGWKGHHSCGTFRGGWFVPLFMLFILFFIFKSGLWLPLLLLGAFLWFMPAMRRYWHEGGREQMREWGEKAKREWESNSTYRNWDEKPKRKNDDTEYI